MQIRTFANLHIISNRKHNHIYPLTPHTSFNHATPTNTKTPSSHSAKLYDHSMALKFSQKPSCPLKTK